MPTWPGWTRRRFAGGEFVGDDFAAKLDPCLRGAAETLEDEAIAAEDARAEALLEADAEDGVRGAAEEAVPVDHVFLAGSDGDGEDVAGDFRGKGDGAGGADGGVFRHEEGAAADGALEGAKEAAAAAMLGGGVHIDGGGHPGEFPGDGDDAFARVEMNLEHRHGGADDFVLHGAVVAAGARGVKAARGNFRFSIFDFRLGFWSGRALRNFGFSHFRFSISASGRGRARYEEAHEGVASSALKLADVFAQDSGSEDDCGAASAGGAFRSAANPIRAARRARSARISG